ncbi:MAG: YidB family protein [Syntrophobacteraceae bacterium]|nr:YidB family protein [Syntrophobacteraceae bacterium]
MSFFEDLAQKVAGGLQGQKGELVEGAMGFLTSRETGGLEGLAQTFKEKGLGHVISSWVGEGENAAITPQQVEEVMGRDVVQELAQKANISVDEAKTQLSQLLPSLIDKVTPEGKMAEGGLLDKGMELLGAPFSKK